jgi:hypothetical protein
LKYLGPGLDIRYRIGTTHCMKGQYPFNVCTRFPTAAAHIIRVIAGVGVRKNGVEIEA